ncbi:MAG: hypothetical protein K6G87_00190 [Butyrivibrio sp.]|uniref:hypothetical protein n=1 Tax=Butyrivibrio sp. TaxID=28121 RepID=UPI0025D1284B|nr:hypothetical protein [Butyrivibrio sp.]MCR5769628.1 hypothetical protein [Butyrivibrio sp.]
MIFGQNYFNVLTGRIGGAGNIWNRQGLSGYSSLNNISRNKEATGAYKTGYSNSYYGLSAGTIKAMNNAFGTIDRSYSSDIETAQGAVKLESAARKLSNEELYEEKNTKELLKAVMNFTNGYNEVNDSSKETGSIAVRRSAGNMREAVRDNISDLRKVGIGYNSKNGELFVDDEVFQKADKEDVKNIFADAGSFGQQIKSSAAVTSQAAVASGRYLINRGIYGANGAYGLGSYGGYSSLLSTMFSTWI